jgi:hypothetical protein
VIASFKPVIVSFKLVIELCNPAVIGSFEPAVIVCLVQASCDRPTSCDRLGYLLQARCDRLVQAVIVVIVSFKPAVMVSFKPAGIVPPPASQL